jgi:hypothetical protein
VVTHSGSCEDMEDKSLSSACLASAALQQEHAGSSGIGSEGSCAAHRGIGNSVQLTQRSSDPASVDIAFDAAMVLLKSVVEVATRSMPHLPAKLKPDRSGIGIMAVCGDPCLAAARVGRFRQTWRQPPCRSTPRWPCVRRCLIIVGHSALVLDMVEFHFRGGGRWTRCRLLS